MWDTPLREATELYEEKTSQLNATLQQLTGAAPASGENNQKETPAEDTMATQEASFDPDKTLCCTVENSHTLIHGAGGRGYGLGGTPVTSGCYQWKVG